MNPANLHRFCACKAYLYGHGPVLIWRRCDMLSTSVFWMTLHFHSMGPMGQNQAWHFDKVNQVAAPVGWKTTSLWLSLAKCCTEGEVCYLLPCSEARYKCLCARVSVLVMTIKRAKRLNRLRCRLRVKSSIWAQIYIWRQCTLRLVSSGKYD